MDIHFSFGVLLGPATDIPLLGIANNAFNVFTVKLTRGMIDGCEPYTILQRLSNYRAPNGLTLPQKKQLTFKVMVEEGRKPPTQINLPKA